MISLTLVASLLASAAQFEAKVRPTLVTHCYKCHSAQAKPPKAGLRLDTRDGLRSAVGKPGDSPLLKALHGSGGAEQMPPTGPLPARVVADIAAWVKSGAVDPRVEPVHWAFKPIIRQDVPGQGHPIDHFIRVKLAEKGLKPAPEADRRTLIRRLTFDLHGLPPTPEEVDAFVADLSPDAYEKLVDRLLASPRYGERWARHWLDVIRFAESHGFEMNQMRPNAWRYRDYVIRSFNDDKPFDRFVQEQIAGDVLGVDEATGFLVAGPWDQVKSPDPVLTAQQRADELHDIVSVTGSAILGLTVGCARCHDHKFDPISTADYHALKAIFAGVQHADRALMNSPDAVQRKEVADKLRRELEALDAKLLAAEPLAEPTSTQSRRAAVSSGRNVEKLPPTQARYVRFTIMAANQYEPCLDELEVFTTKSRNVAREAKLRSSGNYPPSELHKLEHLTDGRYGNGRSWISNQFGKGWVELELSEVAEIDRIVWSRDREGKFTDRTPTIYRIEVATERGHWKIVASSDDRASEKVPSPDAAKRAELEKRLAEAAGPPMAYVGRFAMPEPVRRLNRGDPMQPREAVPPGALTVIAPRLELMETTPEQQRRLALAKWLTDARNPLTARVIVNRVWQQHFGTGLVETPSDFGRNGMAPSHPELLDWLASDLASGGRQPPVEASKQGADAPRSPEPWSLKRLHKLIVTSATYKQSSGANEIGLKTDAVSRLLWRYPPRRLEAESLRDSILAVSGKLDLTPGGPGFDLFEPNANYVKVYTPKKEFGPDTFRRMIYWAKPRMQTDDTFGAFDCPDAGQIAPKRSASITPLQALNLLNSPFAVQQANSFAERIGNGDVSEQVRRAFRLAFQREPKRDEADAAAKLVKQHGLAALTRALLNANEFVFVD